MNAKPKIIAALSLGVLLVTSACQTASTQTPTPDPSTTAESATSPESASPTPSLSVSPTPTTQPKVTPKHETWVGQWGLTQSDTASTGNFEINQTPIEAVGDGRRVSYLVQVEDSVGVPANQVAEEVHEILIDERGWSSIEGISFNLVTDPAQAEFVLSVASPATTDQRCLPNETMSAWSCRMGDTVNLNSDRWLYATPAFDDYDLQTYRQYLVNHEVGHWLGWAAHDMCPAPGEPAPIMQQQSMDLQGCTANGWPTVAGRQLNGLENKY